MTLNELFKLETHQAFPMENTFREMEIDKNRYDHNHLKMIIITDREAGR